MYVVYAVCDLLLDVLSACLESYGIRPDLYLYPFNAPLRTREHEFQQYIDRTINEKLAGKKITVQIVRRYYLKDKIGVITKTHVIIIASSQLKKFTDAEWPFILMHECGHAVLNHTHGKRETTQEIAADCFAASIVGKNAAINMLRRAIGRVTRDSDEVRQRIAALEELT